MSFLHLSGPLCHYPLAPLSDLLPLADDLWGSFARLFVVLSPSWTPGFACFGLCFPCPLFVFGLFLGSSLAVAPLCVSFCLCFCLRFCGCLLLGLCVPPLVFRGFLVCCFWCAVGWLPSPAGCCLPSPLRLFPCDVLVQLLCWSLPLGIWLLHATARLPCSFALGVVVLCFLASSCFMAAKAFGPVWGFVLPSTPWCRCCCCALCPALRYSSLDDPGPPLDAAKLHTRHSLLHVWHTLLLSSSAFPAPSLPPSCLVVCVFVVVWCFSFPLCSSLYLHLGERSLELSSLRGCFPVCLVSCLMLNFWQGKSFAY